MERPEATSKSKVWAGQISNASPHMLPLGAALEQTNARCQTEGQLDVRPGIQPCTFSNAIEATDNDILGMYFYPQDLNDIVLYQDSDGNLKAGRAVRIA